MFKLIASMIVGVMFISGCSMQAKYWGDENAIPLKSAAKSMISSTRVVVGVERSSAMGTPSIAGGGSGQAAGLLGALIESAIVHSHNDGLQDRQRHLASINKAVIDFNFGSRLRAAIEEKVKPIQWLNIDYVVKKHDLNYDDINKMAQNLSEDAILLIDNKYAMSEDYSELEIDSYVAIFARHKKLVEMAVNDSVDLPPVLYKKLFKQKFNYDGDSDNKEAAIISWSQNNNAKLLAAFNQSIEKIASTIVAEFAPTSASATDSSVTTQRLSVVTQ